VTDADVAEHGTVVADQMLERALERRAVERPRLRDVAVILLVVEPPRGYEPGQRVSPLSWPGAASVIWTPKGAAIPPRALRALDAGDPPVRALDRQPPDGRPRKARC